MPIESVDQRFRLEFFSLAWLLITSLLWLILGGPAWLPIPIVLIFIGLSVSAGRLLFRRTPFDFPLLLFGLMALVGVWAAYQRQTAWEKFWMLSLAILAYYAIASQLQRNSLWLTALLSFLGALISLHFLLVFDWHTLLADFRLINRIGLAWMALRPALPGQSLMPNTTAGILASFFPYTLALGFGAWQHRHDLKAFWLLAACAVFFAGLLGATILLTSSRGAWIALTVALVFWLFWALSEKLAARFASRRRLFPVIGFVAAGIFASAAVLAVSGGVVCFFNLAPGLQTGQSRIEIDSLTLHLLGDFPFTGGGLGSFTGLFSEYMLVIPSIMVSYAHNLYLDVALEQGLLSLVLMLFIMGGSALLMFRPSKGEEMHPGLKLLRQAALASLVVIAIHGLIDDPLYGERGSPFMWIVAGLSVFAHPQATTMASFFPAGLSRWRESPGARRRAWLAIGLLAFILVLSAASAWRTLAADWLANLGAVRMSQVQLSDFPTNEWSDGRIVSELGGAQRIFEQVVLLDPANRTANHRLGLIAILRRDYPSAIGYLETAYRQDPGHRGVVKNLGYSYVWAGQYDSAQIVLASISEAKNELDTYHRWWATMGRMDLAENAEHMVQRLAGAD